MTFEEMKSKLNALNGLKRLVRAKDRQIREERELCGIAAVDYSRERISGGSAIPMQQRYVERIEKLEAEYDSLFDRMCKLEDSIAEALHELSDLEQAIVIEKYMCNKPWRDIELEYNYSERHMRRKISKK